MRREGDRYQVATGLEKLAALRPAFRDERQRHRRQFQRLERRRVRIGADDS